ncbi:MAG: hypothetical protein BWZ10_03098 [candidate division BRC1 bacterium ADurb.BinA364]|nr:MAG: hypothetical protein BWZ10_03098 [candidate division BRC1 bacterium ADurb.BinA364]
MTDEAGLDRPRAYCDLGTNYPLLFAEIGKLGVFDSMFSCSPVPGLEDSCARYGAQVVAAPPDGLAAASAFEQLEHVFSPLDYLRGIHRALAGGGLLFLTTRTISGFDLQMLWGHSPYIYAPEHLNLLSVEGIARLLERAGFEMHELSTPGQLDVELAKAAAEGDPAIPIPPFFRYVLSRRGRETLEDWQAFLQKHRLSSHARLAAVKRPSHAGACLAR